jgi:hypothetical protein
VQLELARGWWPTPVTGDPAVVGFGIIPLVSALTKGGIGVAVSASLTHGGAKGQGEVHEFLVGLDGIPSEGGLTG